jgi:hypothetical protein
MKIRQSISVSINVCIASKWTLKGVGLEVLDRTDVAQNMDRRWTVVCTVMNLRFSRKTADFCTG